MGKCCYCERVDKLTKDHFYPKSKGGATIVMACARCNFLKGDMLPEDWIDKIRWMVEIPFDERKKIILNTQKLLNDIPEQSAYGTHVLGGHPALIDLRAKLEKVIDKPRPKIKTQPDMFRICPSCGFEKRTSLVNQYTMIRYWKNGSYCGSANPVGCDACS